jgi:hypothetical protein
MRRDCGIDGQRAERKDELLLAVKEHHRVECEAGDAREVGHSRVLPQNGHSREDAWALIKLVDETELGVGRR